MSNCALEKNVLPRLFYTSFNCHAMFDSFCSDILVSSNYFIYNINVINDARKQTKE